MVTGIQKAKAEQFLKFHQDEEILVLLNSWDTGSSKLIEACGYKAIATTSMGVAASLGYPDSQVIQLSEMIEVISGIVKAVEVPVSVDIEAGYGNNINEVIESVKKIIATGIVGINIEDSIDMSPVLIDEMEFCERISAIRALADSLGFHLVINARTDSFYTSSGSPQEKLSESITAYSFSLYGKKQRFQHWSGRLTLQSISWQILQLVPGWLLPSANCRIWVSPG